MFKVGDIVGSYENKSFTWTVTAINDGRYTLITTGHSGVKLSHELPFNRSDVLFLIDSPKQKSRFQMILENT